jgi:hypothetical protein
MRGRHGNQGQCRLACEECTPCAKGDDKCLAKSREEQGFLPDVQGELNILFPEDEVAGKEGSQQA